MEGPDHKASLEPRELKQMVDSIRHIEEALGDGKKKPADIELSNINIARKSIVAKSLLKEEKYYLKKILLQNDQEMVLALCYGNLFWEQMQ